MNTRKVWTPGGYTQGPTNSLVGKGESIINYNNGTGTLVTKGKVGVDNQPSSVSPDDDNVIAGNDVDWSNGRKFSEQIAPYTQSLNMINKVEQEAGQSKFSSLAKQTAKVQGEQLQQIKAPLLEQMKLITDRLKMQHDIINLPLTPQYDGGKSSYSYTRTTSGGKVPTGWLESARIVPAAIEGKMLNWWMKNKPYMPNIYAPNKYASAALDELNRQRVDPYSQLQALNKQERAAYYRMQQNGGYTGGLRQNARVAMALGNARNAAEVLHNNQLENNKLRQQWATTALQEGNQEASRRQAANQYAWEAYNKAHGAKVKGIETHLANLGGMWQKYWADKIKNKQYEDTLSMYQQDVNNRKAGIDFLMSGGPSKSYNSSYTNLNFGSTPAFKVDKLGTQPLGQRSPFAAILSASTGSSTGSVNNSPASASEASTAPLNGSTGYNGSTVPWLTNYTAHTNYADDPYYLNRPNDAYLGNLGTNNTIQYGYARNGRYPNPYGINYQAMNGPKYYGDMRYMGNYLNGGFRSNYEWLNDGRIGSLTPWVGSYITNGYDIDLHEANRNNHGAYYYGGW